MALFTDSEDVTGLLPSDYGALVVRPLERESVAFQVSTLDTTTANAMVYPIIDSDVTAAFVEEGDLIPMTDASFKQLTVKTAVVAAYSELSRQLADDSNPDAAENIVASIVRALQVVVDQAYFGDLDAPNPKGLESIPGAEINVVAAPSAFTDLDPFAEALSVTAEHGGNIRYWVAHPTDRLALWRLKRQTDNIEPLLGMGVGEPGATPIYNVPMLVSPAVTPGTIWGIDPSASRLLMNSNVEINLSEQTGEAFRRLMIGIRGFMRVGFGFPHSKALAKIVRASGGS